MKFHFIYIISVFMAFADALAKPQSVPRGKLTPQENEKRLKDCGKIQGALDNWLWVAYITDRSNHLVTGATRISPRHILMSPRILKSPNGKWINSKIVFDCTKGIPSDVLNHFRLQTDHCYYHGGGKNCQILTPVKANFLEYCDPKSGSTAIIVEVDENLPGNDPCMIAQKAMVNRGDKVNFYRLNPNLRKFYDYELTVVTDVHKFLFTTVPMNDNGLPENDLDGAGGPLLRISGFGSNGITTLIGYWNFSLKNTLRFDDLRWYQDALCELAGICELTSSTSTTTPSTSTTSTTTSSETTTFPITTTTPIPTTTNLPTTVTPPEGATSSEVTTSSEVFLPFNNLTEPFQDYSDELEYDYEEYEEYPDHGKYHGFWIDDVENGKKTWSFDLLIWILVIIIINL